IFTRHPNLFTAGYMVLAASGISAMTVFLGGLASPYYAGLSLVIIGAGLLFVWPAKVVVATHSVIVLSFVLPNFMAGEVEPLWPVLQGGRAEPSVAHGGTFASMCCTGLKLLKMIADLLDLSRMEESKMRLKVAEHALAEYLRALVSQVQPLAQRKGIELSLRVEARSTVVWCDLERIERVFLNLLSNATKFTQPGGHVQVIVREASARIEVVVQDDGPGFPPEKADRIFERFYQV